MTNYVPPTPMNRWGPMTARLASLVLVPAMLAALTGGFEHTGYWAFYLVAASLGSVATAWGVIISMALFLLPVWLLLTHLVEKWKDQFGVALTFVVAGIVFIARSAEFAAEAPPDLTFPLDPPGVGFGVLALSGTAAIVGAFIWAGRLKTAPPRLEHQSDPLFGWRLWGVDDDDVLVGVRERWESEEMVASCIQHHHAPDWRCQCGIYATRDLGPLALGGVRPSTDGEPVLGRAELWGDIVEHTDGFRASHARITDLWVGDDQELFLALTVRYPEARVWMGAPAEGGDRWDR